MKSKNILIIIITVLSTKLSLAQNAKFAYDYDAAGNRIQRIQLPPRYASPKDTMPVDAALGGYRIKIYPNPTAGSLTVAISDFSIITKSKAQVYDMQSRLIFSKEPMNETTGIDLSREKSGDYFLRIYLDGKMKQWKVVKTD